MKEEKYYCGGKRRKYSNYLNFDNQSNLQKVEKRDFQIKDDRISIIEKEKVCLALNIQNGKLFRFPAKARLIICKKIYELIVLNHSKKYITKQLIIGIKEQVNWTTKIPKNDLDRINKKINEDTYKELIIKYFDVLFEILLKILKISQSGKTLNVKEFSEKLIKSGLNLNLKIDPLRFFIKDLIEFLKSEFKDFKIKRISKQELYYSKDCKECARCHKIKIHSKFLRRKGGSLESICKKCKQEIDAIRREMNKLYIIKEIYEGKSLKKCQRCNTDISKLPAIDFHHHTSKKTIEWSKYRHSNYKKTLKILEKDRVILLCANCHSKEQSSTFNQFEDVILKPNLFEYSAIEIRTLIFNTVKKRYPEKTSDTRSKIKYNIMLWIKKRYIIEGLYNGKCIGCGEVTAFYNLPSLIFHHNKFNQYKENIWRRIQTKEVEEIIRILKTEKCMCLCSNCHRLLHAPYFLKYIISFLKDDEKVKAKTSYEKLIRNVKNFSYKDRIIKDPLKLKFEYGEKWKKYMLNIYKYCKNKGDFHFNSLELIEVFQIGIHTINKTLKILLNRNLIQLINEKKPIRKGKLIIGQIPRLYRLTNLGITEAQELLV